MTFEHYVRKGTRELRYGYTTGTCAALAADIATRILLTGEIPEKVSLMTKKGMEVEIVPHEYGIMDDHVWAAVPKDAGDDSDITDGMSICARVSMIPRSEGSSEEEDVRIIIDGGEGVGRVTRAGLDQPIGNAAINSGPREMISRQVMRACLENSYNGDLEVIIYVPGGREAAQKTFNSNLGIEGGISILGTTGIVEPMSQQALLDTIELEMKQDGMVSSCLIMTPGNYGMDYIAEYGLDRLKDEQGNTIPVLKFSNFLGETLDMLHGCGIKEVVLVAHAGKLVKAAGGIMNTHSSYADCRREIICAHSALMGGSRKLCEGIMDAATTDACFDLLEEAGLSQEVLRSIMDSIRYQIERRAGEDIRIGAIMFSKERGTLGITDEARDLIRRWKE